ncbi:hypothetical protein [Kribbella sp. DT2]|uniref:hypothetical protein n=1 Tax=Kribbella sp. DT2 TaxID=3393427 RepID=UPI003CEBCD7A
MVLAAAGCAGGEAPDPAPDVFGEYTRSGSVVDDRFPSAGSGDDRVANFAAMGTPEQIQSRLLAAFPCSDSSSEASGFDTSC